MSEALVSVKVGSLSVVYETWEFESEEPENAIEGIPSLAASQAAPLKHS